MTSTNTKPKIKKAFILAAGFGTRLKPLTDNLPKALVDYKGKPMIENVINKLSGIGISEFIINTHHHSDKMEEYFSNRQGDEIVTLLHEKEILGTGGAIKNAEKYFNDAEDLIIYNTDVDCNVNLNEIADFHIKNNSSVTLAVKKRDTYRFLLTDKNDRIIGRTENGENKVYLYLNDDNTIERKAFCGIHIINTKTLDFFPKISKFDIIPVYMDLIMRNCGVYGYDIGKSFWKDLGIPENL